MSGGKQKRSSRDLTVHERKAEHVRSKNKAKGKGLATSGDSDSQESNVDLNMKRKRSKTKSIHDLVGNSTYEDYSSDSSEETSVKLPESVLPEIPKLRLLLETLRKRDGRSIFAEPVNPDEVEGYYETIKEPMDFGTMMMKLNEGRYKTLADFEHDITLVYTNAMVFNASATVFYRQARYIKDLAKKLFALLKADPDNFERAVSDLKVRAGRREDTGVLISKPCTHEPSTNRTTSNGPEKGIPCQYDKGDQLGAYKPRNSLLKQNELSQKNAEPHFPIENSNPDGVGCKLSWKQFVKNLGAVTGMAAGPELSTDIKAFSNHSTNAAYQLETQNYGAFKAPSGNIEEHNRPDKILWDAIRRQYLSGLMGFQGGGVNGKKVFDTRDYNEALTRGIIPIRCGMGNPDVFRGKSFQASVDGGTCDKIVSTVQSVDNPQLSATRNFLNNSQKIMRSTDKDNNVQLMLPKSSNYEEIFGNYRGNIVQPVIVGNNIPKTNSSNHFIGNYYPIPGNQLNSVSGSINNGITNTLMEDPSSFYPLISDRFPERTSVTVEETEGTAVGRYFPNMRVGSSNPTTLTGAENSYFNSAENIQGNSVMFYPGHGVMGMNVPMASGICPGAVLGNPCENLKQAAPPQSTRDDDSAFNRFIPSQGFGAGYFTNLLLTGYDPLAELDEVNDTREFIQSAQYQDTQSVQVPGINLSVPTIQDPGYGIHHRITTSASLPSSSLTAIGTSQSRATNMHSLNFPFNDQDTCQPVGGYGGSTSNAGMVGQACQTLSWPPPSEWKLQPNFYIPVQGDPMTAATGISSQATALMMQRALATHGVDEVNMAGPSNRNNPSNS